MKIKHSIFRFLYWLLYHPLAWAYDIVAALVSGNRWKTWVLSSLPHLTGPKVLEIGHGPGHLQVALAKRGIFSIGIDASRQMNRLALKKTTPQLNTMLINGYAQFMPFSKHAFDQVVATFPAEYIYDAHTLLQIQRILKPGGQLILLPGASIHSKKFYDRFLAWLFRFSGLSPAFCEPILDHLHKFAFDPICFEENLGDSSVLFIIATKLA